MKTRKIEELTKQTEEKGFFFKNASYQKLYKMQVEYENDIVDDLLFGWKIGKGYLESPDIMGYNLEMIMREGIHLKIYGFCEKYRNLLFKGIPLETVVKMDPENIFNYDPISLKEEPIKTYEIRKMGFRKRDRQASR